MLGIEFAGDIPFERRQRALGDPGARRAADVEVARHRHRPAGPDRRRPAAARVRAGRRLPGLRRRRRALRPAGQSSTQDVRFNEEKIAQGRQLANKLWNAARLVLLRVPEDVTVPGAAPAPGGGRGRAGSSRACRPRRPRSRAAIDAFEFHHAALGLYDFVYGDLCDWYLEMVKPRLYADDNRDGRGARAARARRDARARAPDHPVRDRGDLVVHARRRLAADGARYPEPDDALRDEAAEAEVTRAIAATQALRGWRDGVGAAAGQVRARPPRGRAATTRTADARRAARARRVVGRRRRAGRDGRRPGRQRRRARLRGARPRGRGAPRRRPARHAAEGDRARRGQARERGLRRQGTRRGGGGRAREARAPASEELEDL